MTGSVARPLWVIGDIHGEAEKLRALLVTAGLLDRDLHWSGGSAVLVCLGDYVDRGPDGLGVIDLLMRLEGEAQAAGGRLYTLLGNHEPMLLAARSYGDAWRDARGRSFVERWRLGRGQTRDLHDLTPQMGAWLTRRPVVVRVGPYLFVHADATMYLRYGQTLRDVNLAFYEAMHATNPTAWDKLLRDFAERGAFGGENGVANAEKLLSAYGGERLVHGHTPIAYVLQVEPTAVKSPLLYANGRCLNVDGGLAYHPQAGFLVRLGPVGVERVVTLASPATKGRHTTIFG